MGADARLFLAHPPPISVDPVRVPAAHRAAPDERFVLGHSAADRLEADFERPALAQKPLPLAPDRGVTRHTTNCTSRDDPG